MFNSVDLIRVLTASIAVTAWGFAWYGPMLFGKQWMKLMGINPKNMEKMKKEMNMGKIYGISLAGTIVTTFCLGLFLSVFDIMNPMKAAVVGSVTWLGFVAPVQLTEVLFGKKPLQLFYINTGYQLTSILIMAAILGF